MNRCSNRYQCLPYVDVEIGPETKVVLDEILNTFTIPAVLIRSSASSYKSGLFQLIDIIQLHDTAALLVDDVELCRGLHADGVHLSPGSQIQARYSQARQFLGKHFIIGASTGESRHAAMVLG